MRQDTPGLRRVPKPNENGAVQQYISTRSRTHLSVADEPLLLPLLHLKTPTDLERAPGARSIADEFSGVTILVQKFKLERGAENTVYTD